MRVADCPRHRSGRNPRRTGLTVRQSIQCQLGEFPCSRTHYSHLGSPWQLIPGSARLVRRASRRGCSHRDHGRRPPMAAQGMDADARSSPVGRDSSSPLCNSGPACTGSTGSHCRPLPCCGYLVAVAFRHDLRAETALAGCRHVRCCSLCLGPRGRRPPPPVRPIRGHVPSASHHLLGRNPAELRSGLCVGGVPVGLGRQRRRRRICDCSRAGDGHSAVGGASPRLVGLRRCGGGLATAGPSPSATEETSGGPSNGSEVCRFSPLRITDEKRTHSLC